LAGYVILWGTVLAADEPAEATGDDVTAVSHSFILLRNLSCSGLQH